MESNQFKLTEDLDKDEQSKVHAKILKLAEDLNLSEEELENINNLFKDD